jgi:ATP-dependent DNA helicase RecG
MFDYLPPKDQAFLDTLGIQTEQDALFYFPRSYEDRRCFVDIENLSPGTCVTYGQVQAVYRKATQKGKRYINVNLTGASGRGVSLQFFNYSNAMFTFLENTKHLMVYGDVLARHGADMGLVMYSPDMDGYATPEKPGLNFCKIVPVYALTKGLLPSHMRSVMHKLVSYAAPNAKSYIFKRYEEQYNLPPLHDSLLYAHMPPEDANIEILNAKDSKWHKRLKYEELFLYSICIEKTRQKNRVQIERPACNKILYSQHAQTMYTQLHFKATQSQMVAVRESVQDIEAGRQLRRLLHGDVCAGKTTVAAELALYIHACNGQTAFMAPTETLCEQHFQTLSQSLNGIVRVALLTGSMSAKDKKAIKADLAAGEIAVIVGTHALFQKSVQYQNLMLAVIDEQHKFGADQRTKLHAKGEHVHLLQMSATPIPRSLTLSLFGDMDVSVLERIPGRMPPKTAIVAKLSDTYRMIHTYLDKEQQVYVVCPLIEESEKIDLRSAVETHETLCKAFPQCTIALLHGRLSNDEKHEVMQRFKEGSVHILVATTVIEVGIDNPNANLMIIDHAERFGLSQLHQLRGRVGRDGRSCDCLLVCSPKATDDARKKLAMMEATHDGFKIAEADLEIRGPGDFFGTDQSGFVNSLHVADILKDLKAFEYARRDAATIIAEYPDLYVHSALRKKVEQMLETNYV